MADDETTPSATLGKGRMEAFSDGVLAIAITLLVLDVAIRPPGSPIHQFLRGWPSYLAYLVSFLTIGGAWIAHHGLTDSLDRVDRIFLRLNLLFLLAVSFLPFPTRLVADAMEKTTSWQRMAAVVYGCTLLAIRLLFAALSAYVRRAHLRSPGVDDPDFDGGPKEVPIRRRRLPRDDLAQPPRANRGDRALLRHRRGHDRALPNSGPRNIPGTSPISTAGVSPLPFGDTAKVG